MQWTPEIVQLILEMSRQLNENFFPFSIIIPVGAALLFVILMIYARQNPGTKSSSYLKVLLAMVYFYSGITIMLMLGEFEAAFAAVGIIAMWAIALLLLLDAYWKKSVFTFTFDSYRWVRVIGIILIFTGLLVYPLVEILTGHVWPEMVLFTAECPTTISLIGLYLTAVPKTNKLLLAIVSLNAVYTGFAVALAGFLTDILYGIAGVFGLVVLLVYWKQMPFRPLREDQSFIDTHDLQSVTKSARSS